MGLPLGAEAGTTLLPGSHVNRLWSNYERLLSGVALRSVSSLLSQPESSKIDFAEALFRELPVETVS